MEIIKEISIDPAITNSIEAIDYEIASRKTLIAFMLSSNMEINTESFTQYQQEMVDFVKQFEEKKQWLEQTFVRPILSNDQRVSWELDYLNSTIIVKELK